VRLRVSTHHEFGGGCSDMRKDSDLGAALLVRRFTAMRREHEIVYQILGSLYSVWHVFKYPRPKVFATTSAAWPHLHCSRGPPKRIIGSHV
jgi:hypothetical protein